MIRLGVHSCDNKEKEELFHLAISEDKEFSGIETDPICRPKREKVTNFPDDFRLDEFFNSKTTVLEPRPSMEIIDSESFQIHDRVEFINNTGQKLILETDEDILCNLVLWIDKLGKGSPVR